MIKIGLTGMNVIGILISSVVVIGGILAMIRIKLHKKPLEKRIYKLNFLDLLAKLYISIPFLILMILITGLLIYKIITISYFYSFALIFPIIFGFLSIPSLILFRQYYAVEKDRQIELDIENRQMIIRTEKKQQIILNSDIKLVEYFNSTPDKGPYDFEHLKMTLKDGSKWILTNLLNDLSDFEPVFKGVKRQYNKMRIFNKINWG
jgi:frataxin-like iron-binding protein CyaY